MKILSYADIQAPFHIVLHDYRKIVLDRLFQCRTYSGLLLGLPQERMAPQKVESTLRWASDKLGAAPAPLLLPYDLIDYEQAVQTAKVCTDLKVVPTADLHRKARGRCLPGITCAAAFESRMPVDISQDVGMFSYSVAHLVWFQDDFGPPMEEAILGKLRGIDWAAIAVDVND